MKHYNPSISKDINRIFNLKGESTSDVNEEILGVVPIIPKMDYWRVNGALNTASITLTSATATDKDTYLTYAQLSFQKDVTATMTNTGVRITQDGVLVTILRLSSLATTIDSKSIAVTFPQPIKVDRGTAINIITDSVAAGNIRVDAVIGGYTVETTKDN